VNTTPLPARSLKKALLIGFGALLAMAALLGSLSGGSDPGSGGYSDNSSYSTGDTGSGGGTQFYDSGTITTGDDGELIYSDTSGNSFSSGG